MDRTVEDGFMAQAVSCRRSCHGTCMQSHIPTRTKLAGAWKRAKELGVSKIP